MQKSFLINHVNHFSNMIGFSICDINPTNFTIICFFNNFVINIRKIFNIFDIKIIIFEITIRA